VAQRLGSWSVRARARTAAGRVPAWLLLPVQHTGGTRASSRSALTRHLFARGGLAHGAATGRRPGRREAALGVACKYGISASAAGQKRIKGAGKTPPNPNRRCHHTRTPPAHLRSPFHHNPNVNRYLSHYLPLRPPPLLHPPRPQATMTASKHATDTTHAAASTVGAAGAGVTKAATGLLAGAAGVLGTAGAAVTAVGSELVHDTSKVLGGAGVTAKAAGQTVVGGVKTATATVAGTKRTGDDGAPLPGYGGVHEVSAAGVPADGSGVAGARGVPAPVGPAGAVGVGGEPPAAGLGGVEPTATGLGGVEPTATGLGGPRV